MLRDILYFRLCGVRHFIGMPLSPNMRRLRLDPATGVSEREAERLLRTLTPLGTVDLHDPAVWDLHLLPGERDAADAALRTLVGRDFIAVSIGTKWPVNDWGDPNWAALLRSLTAEWPDLGLVLFGATEEFDRSAELASHCRGPTLNLCGQLAPRASGAALRQALAFLGHDSGPMHLAAAVGTPCVAVFGNRNPPRRWHPIGVQHRLIHNICGVMAISPAEVHEAASQVITTALRRPNHETGPISNDQRVAAA
jgi:ADP-heptose:LPS heptosyltransferase